MPSSSFSKVGHHQNVNVLGDPEPFPEQQLYGVIRGRMMFAHRRPRFRRQQRHVDGVAGHQFCNQVLLFTPGNSLPLEIHIKKCR